MKIKIRWPRPKSKDRVRGNLVIVDNIEIDDTFPGGQVNISGGDLYVTNRPAKKKPGKSKRGG